MNPSEALILTRIVRAAFPQQKMDEFTIDVWAEALKDVDFGEARAAVIRLVGKQPFAAVAEIVAEVKIYRRDAIRRLNDVETLRAIEAAKHDHTVSDARTAYLEARAAFGEALAAKWEREGRNEDGTDEQKSA